MYCKNCGEKIEDGGVFCPRCGAPVASDSTTETTVPVGQPDVTAPTTGSHQTGKDSKLTILFVAIIVVSLVVIGFSAKAIFFDSANGSGQQNSKDAPATQIDISSKPSDGSNGSDSTGSQGSSSSSSDSTGSGSAHGSSSSASSEAAAPAASAPAGPPVFTRNIASSEEPGDKVTPYYGPNNLTDGNARTCWADGVDGTGIGEWFRLEADSDQAVKGIKVLNGYCKSEKIYYQNSRPQKVTVSLSNGHSYEFTLSDTFNEYQTLDFGSTETTSYVQVTIDSTYAGNTWNDTSVSEVQVY